MAIGDFEAILKECTTTLPVCEKIDHLQRNQLISLGFDMVGFSESFINAHMKASMWSIDSIRQADELIDSFDSGGLLSDASGIYLERSRRLRKSAAGGKSSECARELKSIYKAYFFFIRAFQDAAYRVFLQIKNHKTGKYSGMNGAVINAQNPVNEVVLNIPGYVDWFNGFRPCGRI